MPANASTIVRKYRVLMVLAYYCTRRKGKHLGMFPECASVRGSAQRRVILFGVSQNHDARHKGWYRVVRAR